MPQLPVLLKQLARLAVLQVVQLSSVVVSVAYSGTMMWCLGAATLVAVAQQTVQQLLAVVTQLVQLASVNIIPKEKHVR